MVSKCVQLIFEMVNGISLLHGDQAKEIFKGCGDDSEHEERLRKQLVDGVLQNLLLVVQRNPEQRTILFRSFAKLAGVEAYSLGAKAMQALAQLKQCGLDEEAAGQVLNE